MNIMMEVEEEEAGKGNMRIVEDEEIKEKILIQDSAQRWDEFFRLFHDLFSQLFFTFFFVVLSF